MYLQLRYTKKIQFKINNSNFIATSLLASHLPQYISQKKKYRAKTGRTNFTKLSGPSDTFGMARGNCDRANTKHDSANAPEWTIAEGFMGAFSHSSTVFSHRRMKNYNELD